MLLQRPVKNVMPWGKMRIACPNCSTLYDVPDKLLGNVGRRLRCSQCDHGWSFMPEPQVKVAMPAIDMPADASPSLVAPAPVLDPAPIPDPVPLPDPEMDEALGRRFGQPADEEAKAAMQAALREEELTHPYHDKTASLDHTAPTEADRFADLVRAARNNEMDLEPEPAPIILHSKKNIRLAVPLLIMLILVMIVLERHVLMHVFPATARLFHALHLL